jgi:hypothetical protein
MDAQRVIDVAMCFDVAIFGGYLRDIVIAGESKYNDIDILWPVGTHGSFASFVRILALDGATVETVNMPKSDYMGYHLIKVTIDDKIHLDCVMYPGKLIDWLRIEDVDFTCNLFYRTREVPIGIRYVPEAYKYDPNPVRTIMDLTKTKKFRTILTKFGDRHWVRAAQRANRLINHDWTLEGEFMSERVEDTLTDEFNSVMRLVDMMKFKMKEKAMSVLGETKLTKNCTERVRRKLFDYSDSDSDEVASTQVSETENA